MVEPLQIISNVHASIATAEIEKVVTGDPGSGLLLGSHKMLFSSVVIKKKRHPISPAHLTPWDTDGTSNAIDDSHETPGVMDILSGENSLERAEASISWVLRMARNQETEIDSVGLF